MHVMKYHYLGWIRSLLDPHFLVYIYKSGTLFPHSSFKKVSLPFILCRFYLLHAIIEKKVYCFILHRISGKQIKILTYNMAIMMKSYGIEKLLFKFKI